jgi:hypothetical protein
MISKDGSAGNLAATCSQLRRLCHSSVKQLDFQQLLRDIGQPSAAQQYTQSLQEHFPHCSSIVLQMQEERDYQAVNYMLPALARYALSSTEHRHMLWYGQAAVHDINA